MLEKGLWGENAYIDKGNGMLFRSQEAASAYFAAANAARHPPASSHAAPAPGRRGATWTSPEPATNAMQKMRPVIGVSRNGRA